ncbi:glutamine synthetase family protein [Ovoidimarina sediminis]|uniref:glutamine synthetase family protein n=1 Tax=Ovoidimarina sediminis TaxID=3079856 RepID=UPI00290EEFC6|nr:glutamine synthetase family protein [Rhodophyticola sp. MJ-SS7]MDU8944183.1 glutamine synthetase family protein [Rhodophyticola sp. MJ-SS7]
MSDDNRLVFVGATDLAGLLRGKSFPASERTSRMRKGVGWTPTNVQINCFNTIAETPFGALGDLALVPDPEARLTLAAEGEAPALDVMLGDILYLDGQPWEFCTRSHLKRALSTLRGKAELEVFGAFEHEFMLRDAVPVPGDSYSFRGFRSAQAWAEPLIAALRHAGIAPDTFMKEYGARQYEVTCGPTMGVAVADQAALLRMLVQDITGRFGHQSSFAPILDPSDVGNGVHIHLSLRDTDGHPVTHDADDPHGLSEPARYFIGGILAHLDQILALLAPSEISYLRLTPHRWSAAFNNLGFRDREAAVRICPVSNLDPAKVAAQYNFEVRACDAAASPHLALAALIFAGAAGVRDRIGPPGVTEDDLSLWPEDRLHAAGMIRLPQSLSEALEAFEASDAVRGWFGADFVKVYADHKRSELKVLEGLDTAEKCARYGEVY